jgi:Txe/YoeB family toxin of Txe-Axe toxin-antitoxin module
LTVDDLIKAIKNSTQTVDVLVQCADYYARRGDTEERRIYFIDPDELVKKLELLDRK